MQRAALARGLRRVLAVAEEPRVVDRRVTAVARERAAGLGEALELVLVLLEAVHGRAWYSSRIAS